VSQGIRFMSVWGAPAPKPADWEAVATPGLLLQFLVGSGTPPAGGVWGAAAPLIATLLGDFGDGKRGGVSLL
jgi:hypothetical protein